MAEPKKYFHDPLVLLLLSINTFLTVFGSLILLLRLDTNRDIYVTQYRENLGINKFVSGGSINLSAFAVFLLIVLFVHTVVSMRIYPLHRQFAITVLSLGLLLLTLGIIVSNALLLS